MKRQLFALFILLAVIAAAASPVFAQTNCVEDSWATKAPMQQARSGLGVIAVDGKIYAIGGCASTGIVGTNEMYGPEKDVWINKTSMPTPREHFAIVAYQNKIYCIGGQTGTKVIDERSGFTGPIISNATEVYDTTTDTWETKAPMPYASMLITAQEVDGKIYVIARNIYVYDPINDHWATIARLPSSPYAESSPLSVVVDNKIIVTGEYFTGSDYEQRLYIFDPKTDNLTQGKTGPLIVSNGAAGVTTGAKAPQRVYVLGLASEKYPSYSVNQVYDPKTDTWTIASAMPTNRTGFGAAVINDTLYAIGGEILTYSYDATGKYIQSSHLTTTSINEQYIPIGYGSITPSPTTNSSAPSDAVNQPIPTEFIALIIVIAIVLLIAALSVYRMSH